MAEAAVPEAHVRPEQFGARGDGTHDDGPSLSIALSCGRPVWLGARRYRLASTLVIDQNSASLLAVSGDTVIDGLVVVCSREFTARGIQFSAAGRYGAALRTMPSCLVLQLEACTFDGADGDGLAISAGADSSHQLRSCVVRDNAAHGLSVDTAGRFCLADGEIRDNRRCGVRLHGYDGARLVLRSTLCFNNAVGIALASPRGSEVTVVRCDTERNRYVGLLALGTTMRIDGALVSDGMRLVLRDSQVSDCRVRSRSPSAIDCSGSDELALLRNEVAGTAIGLRCHNARRLEIAGNRIDAGRIGVSITGDARDILVTDNSIAVTATSEVGLRIGGRAQRIIAQRTVFRAQPRAREACAIVATTDQLAIRGCTWRGARRSSYTPTEIGGLWILVVPDHADDVLLDRAPHGIDAVLTTSQVAMLGRLTAVRLASGGDGFTWATIRVNGSGRGAAVRVAIDNGRLSDATIVRRGHGYANGATLHIDGDGEGARVIGQVGLRAPEGRRLRVICTTNTRFAKTLCGRGDRLVPAYGAVTLTVCDGRWRILQNAAWNDAPARKSDADAGLGDEPTVSANRRDTERPESPA